jgi:hypothetical protein
MNIRFLERNFMAVTIMRNDASADEPLIAPKKENGAGYRYCMYFNGDVDIAFADTLDEILDTLIPGYSTLTEEDQDVARIQFAQNAASTVQASILAELEDGDVSQEEYDILAAPRQLPQPTVKFWESQVPLIVVDTSYQPFTEVPMPSSALGSTIEDSNVWIISPMDSEVFLMNLHEIGFIRLMESSATDPE